MRKERLELNEISKEFFDNFLGPFKAGYDASKVINTFWHKYTLHEAMANMYIVLQKTKENEKELPLFKADYDDFIGEAVSVIIAHYFYFHYDFDTESVDIPFGKTFRGAIYPERRGFIDELNAIFVLLSETDSTYETQQDEKATTDI
ncbi:hypothetical protein [Parapedobacter tibetensis]|uniref:hypothetical protein n=1 Tax=Parapedobacter tibetensis TaxID=2972951 RepID=UPI00214D5E88|nr:hypothetical protein [Parapedobacter tibetensis]